MRKIAISALVAASLAVALVLPAAAVTNGGPDNNRYPYYNCAGVGYDTRIDLPDRLAWIMSWL